MTKCERKAMEVPDSEAMTAELRGEEKAASPYSAPRLVEVGAAAALVQGGPWGYYKDVGGQYTYG